MSKKKKFAHSFVFNQPLQRNRSDINIGCDLLNPRKQLFDVFFIYDHPNGHNGCPHLLALIEIRVPSYFSRIYDLFVFPHFCKSCGAVSFFPQAPFLASKVTAIDYFDLNRNKLSLMLH